MNKLWEEYICRMLLKAKIKDVSILLQNRQNFWENKIIKPDIVIVYKTLHASETYIIDTKWKVIDEVNPKPDDDDLKQMFTYNIYWSAKKSMLLYPNSNSIDESFGKFWKGTPKPDDNQCKVGFISVLDKNHKLDINIGEKIINKLID
jgi:5-methylcytosine-specific restriction enzyme subunit McrC